MREDFAFARRERFKMPLKFALMSVLYKDRGVMRQRPFHRGEECFFPHRLGQKILGAALHRVHRDGDVSVAGEEDDRQRIAAARKRGLKVEAAWSGHPQVGHNAAAIRWLVPGEKVRGGGESFHCVATGVSRRDNARSMRRIVIHDIDDGW